MGAVGARQEVLTWRQIDAAVKADAFLTELEAGADDRLPKTAGDAQRLRLMVEGRTTWAMSEDSHRPPIFEIGGRGQGGDGRRRGTRRRGRVCAHEARRGIEARERYPRAHQKAAFDEWGARLTVKFDLGADKPGLWLALAPIWGRRRVRWNRCGAARRCCRRVPKPTRNRGCRRHRGSSTSATGW